MSYERLIILGVIFYFTLICWYQQNSNTCWCCCSYIESLHVRQWQWHNDSGIIIKYVAATMSSLSALSTPTPIAVAIQKPINFMYLISLNEFHIYTKIELIQWQFHIWYYFLRCLQNYLYIWFSLLIWDTFFTYRHLKIG